MTTKSEISDWFDRGVQLGATHLVVVVDTYDHEDYPVYATGDEEARKAFREHDMQNMQRVVEVYDLRMDKTLQMEEHRAMHLP